MKGYLTKRIEEEEGAALGMAGDGNQKGAEIANEVEQIVRGGESLYIL